MQQISDDRIIQAIRDRGLDPTPDLIERTRQQVQARMATSQTPKAVQSADPTRGVAAYDAFLRSQGAALGRQPKPEEGGGFIDIVQAGGAEGMARMFRTIDFATGMDKEPGGFVEGAQKYFEGVAAAPENQPRAGEEDTFTTNLARAIGNMAAFSIPAIAGGAAGTLIGGPAGTVAGISAATLGAGAAASATGGAVEYVNAYDEVMKSTGDEELATSAGLWAGLGGLTEGLDAALPVLGKIGKVLTRADKATGGAITDGIMKFGAKRMSSAVIGGAAMNFAQETGQEVWSDAVINHFKGNPSDAKEILQSFKQYAWSMGLPSALIGGAFGGLQGKLEQIQGEEEFKKFAAARAEGRVEREGLKPVGVVEREPGTEGPEFVPSDPLFKKTQEELKAAGDAGILREVEAPKELSYLADLSEKKGSRVRFVETAEGSAFRGVYDPETGDILLNVNRPDDAIDFTFGHELGGHALKRLSGDAFATFRNKVQQLDPAGLAAAEKMARERQPGIAENADLVAEEGQSYYIEEVLGPWMRSIAKNPDGAAILERIAVDDRSMFRKIGEVVLDLFNDMGANFSTRRQTLKNLLGTPDLIGSEVAAGRGLSQQKAAQLALSLHGLMEGMDAGVYQRDAHQRRVEEFRARRAKAAQETGAAVKAAQEKRARRAEVENIRAAGLSADETRARAAALEQEARFATAEKFGALMEEGMAEQEQTAAEREAALAEQAAEQRRGIEAQSVAVARELNRERKVTSRTQDAWRRYEDASNAYRTGGPIEEGVGSTGAVRSRRVHEIAALERQGLRGDRASHPLSYATVPELRRMLAANLADEKRAAQQAFGDERMAAAYNELQRKARDPNNPEALSARRQLERMWSNLNEDQKLKLTGAGSRRGVFRPFSSEEITDALNARELGQQGKLTDVGMGPRFSMGSGAKSNGLSYLDGDLDLGLPKKPTVLQIARAFQALVKRAIDYKNSTAEDNRLVASMIAQEAKYAISLHPEAIGWYDENVLLTMDVMRSLDPDLAKDENEFVFKAILAATSDGNVVGPQFKATWKIYSNWKNTGSVSDDFALGVVNSLDRSKNIFINLEMIDEMIKQFGWERVRNFFTSRGTVAEARERLQSEFGWTEEEASSAGSSELADEVVPFAIVLGPKLGSFFNNLYGDFSTVTMDRWFMRTIGRITGTQIQAISDKTMSETRNRIRSAALKLSKEELEMIGIRRSDLVGRKIDDASARAVDAFGSKDLRDYSKKLESSGNDAMEEVRKGSNALIKLMSPLVESPASGSHRRWIRQRVSEAQDMLKADGINIENADLQAVLWYLEKEIYETAGYRKRSGSSDYAAAAADVYRDVVGRPSDVYARGTGRVGEIGRTGRKPSVSAANAEARFSLGARNITQRDRDYLSAVAAGDMDTAQRMVDEAAKEAGVPILDDSASEAFRARRAPAPKSVAKAYKLFSTKPGRPGELFPLFVGANEAIPQGIWLDAIAGKAAAPSKTGKPQVKSKLGPLAFRPGWHAGDLPLATHIGVKDADGNVFARRANEVWAEVEVANDIDYQPQANASRTKDLREMPVDGSYRFKTNPNMTGSWIISGSMKINRVLSQKEVDKILKTAGAPSMPWEGGRLDLRKLGLSTQDAVNQLKLNDPVTYDDAGNVIPLSQRFGESPDIRYSMGGFASFSDALDDIRKKGDFATQSFRTTFVDYLNETKKLLEAAAKAPYQKIEAMQRTLGRRGISSARIKDEVTPRFNKLVDAMRSAGVSHGDVADFMRARVQPIAEKVVKERRSKMDPTGTMYEAQITATEAADIMKRLKAQPNYKDIVRVVKMVDDVNQRALDINLASGKIDRDSYDKMMAQYDPAVQGMANPEGFKTFYGSLESMPERSVVDSALLDVPGIGRGVGRTGRPYRGRTGVLKGSDVELKSPVVNAFVGLQNAVIRGVKSEEQRSYAKLVKDLNDPTFAVIHETLPTEDVVGSDGYVHRVPKGDWAEQEGWLPYIENGKWKAIEFKGANRLIAEDLKAKTVSAPIRGVSEVTRKVASLMTRLDPTFMLRNIPRDWGWAFLAGTSKYGTAFTKAMASEYKPALKDLWAVKRGGAPSGLLKQYLDAGAEISSMGFKNYEDNLADLEKALSAKDPNLATKIQNTWESWVGETNDVLENATRYAAFRAAVREGKSVGEAMLVAKEGVALNFEQTGRVGRPINSAFAFFNAGVNGTDAIIRLLTKEGDAGTRARRMAASVVGMGIAAELLNRMVSEDGDDEVPVYDNISEFEKNRNFLFMRPDGSYFKVPIPFGFNAVYAFGRNMAAYMSGARSAMAAATDSVSFAMESASPFGSGPMLQVISPTLLDPIVQWKTNETFTGSKIAPDLEQFGRQTKAPHEIFWKNTADMPKEVAELVAEVTEVGDSGRGFIDFRPDMLEHWASSYMGGVGRAAIDLSNTIGAAYKGEAPDAREAFAVRHFIGEASPYAIDKRYRDTRSEIEQVEARYKQLIEEGDRPTALRWRAANAQLFRASGTLKSIERALDKIPNTPENEDRRRTIKARLVRQTGYTQE